MPKDLGINIIYAFDLIFNIDVIKYQLNLIYKVECKLLDKGTKIIQLYKYIYLVLTIYIKFGT